MCKYYTISQPNPNSLTVKHSGENQRIELQSCIYYTIKYYTARMYSQSQSNVALSCIDSSYIHKWLKFLLARRFHEVVTFLLKLFYNTFTTVSNIVNMATKINQQVIFIFANHVL